MLTNMIRACHLCTQPNSANKCGRPISTRATANPDFRHLENALCTFTRGKYVSYAPFQSEYIFIVPPTLFIGSKQNAELS